MSDDIKTTAAKKGPTKAELEAQIELLKAQLALAQQNAAAPAPAPAPTLATSDVAVVYCSDSLGYAKISNMELYFTRYGEEFVMSRVQFDELVGKYRSWFDRGVLTVSYRNADVASAKGLRTDREVALDAETLESIGRMTAAQLESLWNRINLPAQKDSIVCFYKRKFVDGDAAYRNREKVDLLNRLTDGGFKREQDELSGRYKVDTTTM